MVTTCVARFPKQAQRFAVWAVVCFTICGCEDALRAIPDEPFLFLILTREPVRTRLRPDGDSLAYALLLTVGSSGTSLRHAERFEIARLEDGALLNVLESASSPTSPAIARRTVMLSSGNYLISYSGSATTIGRSSIGPLDSFRLAIESQGASISGEVRIPDDPRPVYRSTGSERSVAFPKVIGAAGYIVGADTEIAPDRVITDTVVILHYDLDPAFRRSNPEFRVVALDTNLYRYMTDSTVARAGVEGARGLFAGVTSAHIPLPTQ